MTTFDERIRALTWGRQLLEELAVDAAAPVVERHLASTLLDGYPLTEELEARLEGLSGYALLLAVRRIERTSDLLERLLRSDVVGWADRARRVARHYPERWELADAVCAAGRARVWAAMYLDRAPGRDGLLR